MKKKETGKTKKMMRILMILAIITSISIGIIACDKKDKPTTGGGDNTVTISGTVDIDGVTLTIHEEMLSGKILWGPTAIVGKSYSAKFGVSGRTQALMVFSKSGCNDGAIGVDVRPGTNINVGGTSLLCG